MQQIAQISNDVVLEFFKTGIPGITAMITALGIFVGTVVSAWKGITNGRLNKSIKKDTDGRFSEMLALINKLSDRVAESEAREKRMTEALARVSARTGHPFTDLDSLIRAEDLGRPPRKPSSGTVPKRRKNSGE